jgi:hypothetical protein
MDLPGGGTDVIGSFVLCALLAVWHWIAGIPEGELPKRKRARARNSK